MVYGFCNGNKVCFLADASQSFKNVIFHMLLTLPLNLLTSTIVAPPSNASKWQMGFNSAFKGLKG
jgi:hypothetical protein